MEGFMLQQWKQKSPKCSSAPPTNPKIDNIKCNKITTTSKSILELQGITQMVMGFAKLQFLGFFKRKRYFVLQNHKPYPRWSASSARCKPVSNSRRPNCFCVNVFLHLFFNGFLSFLKPSFQFFCNYFILRSRFGAFCWRQNFYFLPLKHGTGIPCKQLSQ